MVNPEMEPPIGYAELGSVGGAMDTLFSILFIVLTRATLKFVKTLSLQEKEESRSTIGGMGERGLSRTSSTRKMNDDMNLVSVQNQKIQPETVPEFRIKVLTSINKLGNKDVAKHG